MPFELEQLTANELKALPVDRTCFFFPVSAFEDYGPHLPLSTGLQIARSLSLKLAEKIETEKPEYKCVMVPALPLGVQTEGTSVRLRVRPHVLRDWLVDFSQSLSEQGFRYFACVSGHWGPKQLTTIEDAMKILATRSAFSFRKRALFSVSSALVGLKESLRSPFWPVSKEHGGAKDTSQLLVAASSLVHEDYRALPSEAAPDGIFEAGMKRLTRSFPPYWGNPSQASSELGEKEFQAQIQLLYPKVLAILENRKKPHQLFRSWYSIFPSNGSFFAAWVLLVGIIALFILWLAWFGTQLPV